MGFFDFLKGPDINEGVKEYRETNGAVLIDVRTPEEYREGHIPESMNIPLQSINKVTRIIDDKSTPIFVHCLSGARSRQATNILKQLGYTNVKNIGGISSYKGKIER
ncbi:MAG: rhodanese-like domain-containing protein [Spirochaetales bacterium]|nr:rhodanese-like domain-containing protein [Spirochaetales bacterium]